MDRSPGWGRSDFGVTHWRKLLSRRSIEQDDESTKPSEHHTSEIGSCDRRPNLVVRRVVTHGFPLSVKKAALQWKVRRSNRVKSTRRNVLRAPRVRRLLSDRFSEICGNVKYDSPKSSDVVLKNVLPETGSMSMKTRVKAACFQNDEILERLSRLWHGTQPCNQGALMENEEQGVRSVPVDTRCASVSSESTDGEMAPDSLGSPSSAKRTDGEMAEDSLGKRTDGEMAEDSLGSPSSGKKTDGEMAEDSLGSPSTAKRTDGEMAEDSLGSPSSAKRTDGEMAEDSLGSPSTAKKRKTSRDAGNIEGEVWLSHVVEGNSLKVNFKRVSSPTSDTSVACSPSECRDVESCSFEACASSDGSVLVDQSSGRHDSNNVMVASNIAIKQCFVNLGSRVTADSCAHTGERVGCGRTYTRECADVQHDTPTQRTINANVKYATAVPTPNGDNNVDGKGVTVALSALRDVQNVTKAPLAGSDNSTDVKSVIRGPSTGHRSIMTVTASEGHTSVEKLAGLMTLERYWRVAEALGMAKTTKTHHRQKMSAQKSVKSHCSKIPWKQTKWSDDAGASHRKSTSRNGVPKTKHRTKHGKMPSDPMRLSSKRGVMHAGRWLSLASVVQTSRGCSSVTSPMKRCVSAEEDRSNCVHVCDKVGGCTHQADVEVMWSTSTEPVFSTRQQPALLKGVKSVRAGVAHTVDRPKVGRAKTKVSGMEAVASAKEMKRHVTKVKLPETDVNVFGKEIRRNEKKVTDTKCKEQKQDVQPRLPENVRELATERRDPRTARKLSAVWMQQPEKEVKLPRAEVKVPGMDVTRGRAEVKLPGTEDRLSRSAVKLIKKVTTSPSTIPSTAYYTDICQPGWGTMDSAEGITQNGHVKPPVSTRLPVRADGKTHSEGVLRASRCHQGSRVTTDGQKSTVVKSLFHGTCSDKCVNVRHDTTVSDVSANVKDVTRSKPLALSSDVDCDTKPGATHDDIQKAVSAETECVTNAAANDGHASIKEVVELMTPDSYWSMAEAINTAQKTKISHSNLETLTGSHFQGTSCRRCRCSKSAEKVTVAETEEKVFGKKLKQPENKVKVCESRKWKVFGNAVRLDTQLKPPESGVKLIDNESKPVVQLKLPANKTKVIDTKLKVFDSGVTQSTPMTMPENIKVSDMDCEETVKLPVVEVKLPGMEVKVSGTKVKLLGTEMKLPRTDVKQSCNGPCATYYTDICQPFSVTTGDILSCQVDSVNCLPLSQPRCDNPTKNGHKTNEVVDIDANMSHSTDLHKLSHRGPSVGTVTSCDVTQCLHKQPSPVSRVIEACHVKRSTSAHVPVTAPLPSVTDVKNGDSILKKGCGETDTRSMSVSEWRERKALSRQGKNQGRVEDTVGTGEQTQKSSGAVKFHGRTLLFGPEVPVRLIPFHPLYLFHPIRKSGKKEVIPTDPRPAHYMRKQLTSEKQTAPLRVTLYR